MSKEHDDCVLEVANVLAAVGKVHVDLPAPYDHNHASVFSLSTPPQLCLAGMVPTRAVFTSKVVVPNFGWRKPDVVIDTRGFRYVVDVYDENDTYTGVARKVEAVIASASTDSIVGMALIQKGDRGSYRGKSAEIASLRKTFWAVVGSAQSADPDDPLAYIQALMSLPGVTKIIGTVRWENVTQFDSTEDGWKKGLIDHASKAIENGQVLVTRPT